MATAFRLTDGTDGDEIEKSGTTENWSATTLVEMRALIHRVREVIRESILTAGCDRRRRASSRIEKSVIEGFGREWTRFDQAEIAEDELETMFGYYFDIFPWDALGPDAVGFDMGCGSGRWARLVAPRVGALHCIDPSSAALDVARRSLARLENCRFHLASVDDIPIDDETADFGYALGVLHHVTDTAGSVRNCVAKLKRGAPFLVYLYYALDNRPRWYRTLWRATNPVRVLLSRAPFPIRYAISQMIAAGVYFPAARFAWLAERLGVNVRNFPLAAYRDRSFYVMRTDSLDRFGTRIEKRFTREEIETMMTDAGLERIRFSDEAFWCAVGFKR